MNYEFIVIFFFKQKTAYELRISDWSSDVCSSDLQSRHREVRFEMDRIGEFAEPLAVNAERQPAELDREQQPRHCPQPRGVGRDERIAFADRSDDLEHGLQKAHPKRQQHQPARHPEHDQQRERTEEHTSELPSLMTRSYAVFCFKK